MAPVVLRPLAFGEIIDQAFGLYRKCFTPLVVISLVCSGLPALINLASSATRAPGATFDASMFVLPLIGLVLALLGGALANCASTFVVSEQYLGRKLEAREALERAWPRLGAILVTTMTVGLLTGLGFILLIVPGIIIATGLSLAVTAATVEGIDASTARSRSWALTKDFRGQMFSLMFVYGIIVWIVAAGVGISTAVLGGFGRGADPAALAAGPTLPVLIISAVGTLLTLLLNPILYCILIVAYYDLRVRKEAFDLDLLATTLEHGTAPR